MENTLFRSQLNFFFFLFLSTTVFFFSRREDRRKSVTTAERYFVKVFTIRFLQKKKQNCVMFLSHPRERKIIINYRKLLKIAR